MKAPATKPPARMFTITPGQIATPVQEQVFDGDEAAVRIPIPRGKIGRSEEIATVALFLASDESSFENRIELSVDSGTSAI